MKVHEKVFGIYDANVAAEQITATKYVQSLTPESLSAACMKDIDSKFHDRLLVGKIMVAGPNFGCNSSREWAPLALKYAGVQVVIADSFARIFYRNAINIGLPIFECKNIRNFCQEGDELKVDLSAGVVENVTQGTKTGGTVLPEFLLSIMSVGGLLETLKAEGNGGEAGA